MKKLKAYYAEWFFPGGKVHVIGANIREMYRSEYHNNPSVKFQDAVGFRLGYAIQGDTVIQWQNVRYFYDAQILPRASVECDAPGRTKYVLQDRTGAFHSVSTLETIYDARTREQIFPKKR
ncbi:MAG: hypothetical protein LBL75_01570 [Rickettsiales bacterium]|jgi:hypothetical protein|nr:hypothetical protein [Rickettsiales bacterium]